MGELEQNQGWFPLNHVHLYVPKPPPLPPTTSSPTSSPTSSTSSTIASSSILCPHQRGDINMRQRGQRPVSSLAATSSHSSAASIMALNNNSNSNNNINSSGASPPGLSASKMDNLAARKMASVSTNMSSPMIISGNAHFPSTARPSNPSTSSIDLGLHRPGSISRGQSLGIGGVNSTSSWSVSGSGSGSVSASGSSSQQMVASSSTAASSSSSSQEMRARAESVAQQEVQELIAHEQPSTEDIDNGSMLKRKAKTANMLTAFFKGKRTTAEELTAKGLISTGGSIYTSSKGGKGAVIGMDLDDLLECMTDRSIPIIVDQCVTYLRGTAMKLSGIFRVSPNQAELQALRKLYRSPTEVVDLKQKVKDPHVVAGLLKLWLVSLPEPLLPFFLYEPIIGLFSGSIENRNMIRQHCKVLLDTMPHRRRIIVDFIFAFLYDLSQFSSENKMTPNNLAIVFGPNLVRPKEQTQDTLLNRTNVEAIQFFLEEFQFLFGASYKLFQLTVK